MSVHRFKVLLLRMCLQPSSETQGRSVGPGEKARRKFSSTGERALSPVLENFHRAFSPSPTDRPWVTEDGLQHNTVNPL